jgi:hypothetical protein
VTDRNGNSLTVGTAYQRSHGDAPLAVPTSAGVTTYATWCTSASTLTTGDFASSALTTTALPRPTCASAGKIKWVDYLTGSTPFCFPNSSTACSGVLKPANSLPLLHVALPVNLNGPASTKQSYNLVDDIALMNGARS